MKKKLKTHFYKNIKYNERLYVYDLTGNQQLVCVHTAIIY